MERRVEIGIQDYVVDLLARMQRLLPGEPGFDRFADRHRRSLYNIRRRLGLERYETAIGMLEAALSAHRQEDDLAGYRPFIRFLLVNYYDPMYDYQLSKRPGDVLARGDADTLLQWCRNNGMDVTA